MTVQKIALFRLNNIADMLEECPREGADRDEPEGARYAKVSDSALVLIASMIRRAISDLEAPQ